MSNAVYLVGKRTSEMEYVIRSGNYWASVDSEFDFNTGRRYWPVDDYVNYVVQVVPESECLALALSGRIDLNSTNVRNLKKKLNEETTLNT